ncbi:MAG: hypothetical protein E6713_09520 [Sporomusaceae bacterium]|nr:hypothetical protein [Sporomusaceae bacterium]
MLKISNFRIALTDDRPLNEQAAKRLKLPVKAVRSVQILRRAVDARRKQNITFVHTLLVDTTIAPGQVLAKLRHDKDVTIQNPTVEEPVVKGTQPLKERPVIVGFGPAGMLAAYTLAKEGYAPLVLERGGDMDRRTAAVERFWAKGEFSPESNVQFGEGGAGTFSDGKLTTRVSDKRMSEVLELFVECGAPPDICYTHKPHIGTDILKRVVKNLRQKIIDLGGEVRFFSQVTNLEKDAFGAVKSVTIGQHEKIPASVVLLGIGHSARDTYEMLSTSVAMEAKPFAIGLRIEHPQSLLDQAQYGSFAGHPKLGAADYALVYHDKQASRTAYSFCMCPGGIVVAAASELGGVVTNGMSHHARASGIANSALVVNVEPRDFGPGVLAGIAFQRRYEQLAYAVAGSNYQAPGESVASFLGLDGTSFSLSPTYRPGVVAAPLSECLPAFVTDTLRAAITDFGRKIKGFDDGGAQLTGVETRTSAPVRIRRSANFQSENTPGLYPIGEGAGYAGGIMSAALDGMNAAYAVIAAYEPCS